MATHSSTLAWRIPWREQPGRLQSMGSQRVGHDWATSLACFNCISFCICLFGIHSSQGQLYYLCVRMFSQVHIYETPWTVAHRAPSPWDFPGKNTGVAAISSSRDRDWTRLSCVSCIAGRFFTAWATGEAHFIYIFLFSVFLRFWHLWPPWHQRVYFSQS